MFTLRSVTAAILLSSGLIAGCTSQVTEPDRYSGFMSDYSGLQAVQSASGKEVMRWQDPAFKLSNYSEVVYQPVKFYPAPKPTEQISDQTLEQLLAYTNQQLRAAMGERLKLAQTPGPRTLIFRGAITGVDTANEGLKPYQVIPVALVVSGAMAAAGQRTQDTELYLEGEFVDASSGKPVVKVVRKGFGKKVDNASQVVTFNDLKGTIDDMVRDIGLYK
jgi:hypothetical protein